MFSFKAFYDDILNFKTFAVQVNDKVIYYFINSDNTFASFVDCYEPTVIKENDFSLRILYIKLIFHSNDHYFVTTQLADAFYYNIIFKHFIVEFLHFQRFLPGLDIESQIESLKTAK